MDGLIMFNMVHHQHWPSAPMTWPVLTTTTHDHHGLPSQLCTTLAMMAAPIEWPPGGCTSPAVHHWGCREKCRSGDHNFGLWCLWDFWSSWNHLKSRTWILQRRDSPESSPTFSRKNSVRGPNTSSRWRPFGSSRAWWNPWAMLSNAGPAAGGAEHKASCQKRDFASSTRPGESTWDRRLIPWWSDEKYLENTKLLWLQWMAPDFVDTRDHWNSGVRVERTKKTAEELTTKWVELQSWTREVTEYTGTAN